MGWAARLALLGGPAVIAAMLGWLAWLDVTEVAGLLRDGRIWREGRPAHAFEAHGICRTNVLLVSQCHVFVTYERTPGTTVRNDVHVLVWGGLDSPWPVPVVKVDPADPDSFALNLLMDAVGRRWVALAELNLVAALLCASISLGAWLSLRDAWRWRSLARTPHPVAARVVSSQFVSNPGYAHEIRFEYEHGGHTRTGRQRLPPLRAKQGTPLDAWRYEEPIYLDPGRRQVLALAGPKGAVLVPSSFRPVVLTDAERERVLAAAEAAQKKG